MILDNIISKKFKKYLEDNPTVKKQLTSIIENVLNSDKKIEKQLREQLDIFDKKVQDSLKR